MTQRISMKEARSIIRALNRSNLDKLEFLTIVKRIEELTHGFQMRSFKLNKGQVLLRSNTYDFKPENVSFFSYPPEVKVNENNGGHPLEISGQADMCVFLCFLLKTK